MKNSALYEVPSLGAGDCLRFLSTGFPKSASALHYVSEYELTLLEGDVVRLAIGEMTVRLAGKQLVLLAPDVPHSWISEEGLSGQSKTFRASKSGLILRWPADLLGDKILGKNQLRSIRTLLQDAQKGILFSPETVEGVQQQLTALQSKIGFESVYSLLSLLYELSVASGSRVLADQVYPQSRSSAGDSRIHTAVAFMRANYFHPITLEDVARKARMTKGAFCRSIRKRTGMTYAESLSEIRIGHICTMLLNTSNTVSEIAYKAGFNNVAHFHRCFKRLKGCTPKKYRENFSAYRVISAL